VLAIVGSVSSALMVGRMLFDAGIGVKLARTTVAELQGSAVGFMDGGKGDGDVEPGPAVIARLLPRLLLRAGPSAVLRGIHWMRVNPRVQFSVDPAAYHISELNVAAACRGEGIGRQLLERAEAEASLAGWDAEWERWALSPGRIWMVKELG
jgi:ribosomal protein S18 acetylase RimI-like enzyme